MASPTSARRNHQIRVPEVRVVNEQGEQLGVMPTKQALQLAEEQGVDLVEVSPKATPPVCRLMDYGKYQYQQRKRQQEAKKKQVQVQLKEVKLRPKTDEHDLQTKLDHVRKFLAKGDRCKITLFFRGREIVYKEQGQEIMQNILQELSDVAKVEQAPKFEGRAMHMIVTPLPKK
ncbi:MAG: translation initiation factor IF-3 [Desulfohalobiaceae bacterium]